jgi:hypothetical protein
MTGGSTLKGTLYRQYRSKGSIKADIGAVESMSQAQRPDNSYGLDIEIDNYSFTGTIASTGSGGNNYGGCIGAVLSNGSYKDTNNAETKPGSGFGIIYNTTSLNVSSSLIYGALSSNASGLGGFAAVIEGVDADFTNLIIGGSISGENGLGGLAPIGGRLL